ncbi:MAG: sulfur carrier protein ThiS adenylyltransferase ThiF [Candidatus Cloacimonadaceae bacterium]
MTDKTQALYNELFAEHDPVMLKIWQNSVVGIAGAGGLGSNIAVSLARAGIGKLIIADYDIVTTSNLNRQQFFLDQVGQPKVTALKDNLVRMNPFCEVIVHNDRITPSNLAELFGSSDILIEALDGAELKQMLIEAWQELFPDKVLIGASGLSGYGRNELIRTVKFDNIYLCGDGVSELKPGISPVAPRVGIVANMQANLCLELLIKLNS